MIKNLQELCLGLIFVILLSGCAETPNDVTLTAEPSACVTGVIPGYEAAATTYSSAYPINATLPANSPYCMAMTITNNNSGTNANNIQVNYGLVLTTQYGSNTSTGTLVDFNAAGISASTFGGGQVQNIGNIALFDPNNCVTTLGINAKYINKQGGQCKFYMELTGESLPVGVYNSQLTVRYYNGSNNYSVSTSFNQRVNLYAGGNFTIPANYAALYNGGASAESLPVPFIGNAINLLTRDNFGNIFAYDGSNVYVYDGISWVNIGLPGAAITINAMSSDTLGNIYAATTSGLWVYNTARVSLGWVQLGETGNRYINDDFAGVQASLESSMTDANTIYVTDNSLTEPAILTCNWTDGSNNDCAWSESYIVTNNLDFNQQALALYSGIPYWAEESSIWQLSTSGAIQFTTPTAVNGLESGPFGLDSLGIIYVGFNNQGAELNNPALVSNFPTATSTVLSPLVSASSANLYGSSSGVSLRNITSSSKAAAMVLAYGSVNAFTSADFVSAMPLAYLLMGYNSSSQYVATTNWLPINGINGNVNNATFGSILTSY